MYFFFVSLFNYSGDGGLLIHCISGWDRTPLFISLLRMSLWAVRLFQLNYCSLDLYMWTKKVTPGLITSGVINSLCA